MKPILLLLLSFLTSITVSAQCDTLYLHNGKKKTATIISVDAYTISFTHCGENARYIYGRYAVARIVFASGRTDTISDRIEIKGEEDWQKVIVLEDKTQVAGLRRRPDIAASTSFFNLHTANTGERKAQELLFREAARLRCPFVFLNFDRETNFLSFKTYGALQNKKKAFTFDY